MVPSIFWILIILSVVNVQKIYATSGLENGRYSIPFNLESVTITGCEAAPCEWFSGDKKEIKFNVTTQTPIFNIQGTFQYMLHEDGMHPNTYVENLKKITIQNADGTNAKFPMTQGQEIRVTQVHTVPDGFEGRHYLTYGLRGNDMTTEVFSFTMPVKMTLPKK